jgi:hypothetical protein
LTCVKADPAKTRKSAAERGSPMTLHAMMQATGRALARLGHRLTEDTEEFTCGQCARQESCGLPPSKDCLYKSMVLQERQLHSVPAPHSYDHVLTRRPL